MKATVFMTPYVKIISTLTSLYAKKLLLLLYIVFFTYNSHINYNNIYTNYYAESLSNSCSVFLLLVIGLILLCAGRSRNITNNGMYTLLVHAMCMYSEGQTM